MDPKEALYEFAHRTTSHLVSWPIPKEEKQRMKKLGYVSCQRETIVGNTKLWVWRLTEKGREVVDEMLKEDEGICTLDEADEIEKEFRDRLKGI